MKPLDITGHRYGRLVAIELAENVGRHRAWRARCDCGSVVTAKQVDMRHGRVMSCGCLRHEKPRNFKWDAAACMREARKYNRPVDWENGSGGSYMAASAFGILEECTAHMDRRRRITFELAREAALKHETKEGLRRADPAVYNAIRSNGWADALFSHMVSGYALDGLRRREEMLSRIGTRFGRLTVEQVTHEERRGAHRAVADCRCDCGGNKTATMSDLQTGRVTSCGCLDSGTSVAEQELFAWVRSIASDAISGVRLIDGDRRSWDIVIPSRRLAVEFNGTVWHSLRFKPNRRAHIEKRLAAEKAGFRQITVWQDDYADNEHGIQEMLRRVLTGAGHRIHARECCVDTVDSRFANVWHTTHHLQKGLVRGNHFALQHEGATVAVASFHAGVLLRYTVAGGLTIPGGLGKLIKASGLDHIVTYCDRDYFTGEVYRQSGFVKTGTTMQLTYLHGGKRHRRERFMRHKLPALGIAVEAGQTEREALAAAGIYQCWNSGVDRWERAA